MSEKFTYLEYNSLFKKKFFFFLVPVLLFVRVPTSFRYLKDREYLPFIGYGGVSQMKYNGETYDNMYTGKGGDQDSVCGLTHRVNT